MPHRFWARQGRRPLQVIDVDAHSRLSATKQAWEKVELGVSLQYVGEVPVTTDKPKDLNAARTCSGVIRGSSGGLLP